MILSSIVASSEAPNQMFACVYEGWDCVETGIFWLEWLSKYLLLHLYIYGLVTEAECYIGQIILPTHAK